MALPLFRKTLLALAIATSQPLVADTVNLTGPQASLNSSTYTNPLTLTGQASGNTYAVSLSSGYFSSFQPITNLANLSAAGKESRAFQLKGFGSAFAGWTIMGDLINEGQISSNGERSSGILLTNFAGIWGSFDNSGSISSYGDGAAGIRISSGASIIGDLNNSGAIQANGFEARGITLSGNTAGFLRNSSSIHVSGESTIAITLESGSSAGAIVNSSSGRISTSGDYSRGISIDSGSLLSGSLLTNDGLIQTGGRESIGIYFDHPQSLSTLYSLVNSGEISAQGVDSRAIVLGNGYLDDSPSYQQLLLANSGTLRAEGVAIEAASSPANYVDFHPWTTIHMYEGLIEGGKAAISGAGNVRLDFFGGEIRGDLLGLQEMYAEGNAMFNGQLIQSPLLRVSSLELGQPHTRLEGDLYLVGPGELDLNLHAQTDPSRAILDISGNAIFANDNQIRVKPASEDFRGLPLREYVLLSAEQIQNPGADYGFGLSVTSLSDLLQIQSYKITDTQVTAVVKSMSTAQVGDYLSEHGAQPHLLPAFNAFYGNTLGNLSNEDPLFEATIHSNDQELVRLAQQLAPEVDGATGQTAVSNQNLLGNTLQNRSASLRHGLSSGDGLSETGAWVQVLSSDADQGERSGIPGYDADSQGIAVGVDGKLNAQTILGLAYSYLTSDVRSQSGNKTDIEGHALTLYSGFEQDAWFADASLTYGQSDNQGKRYIAGTRAEGDYDSDLWGLNLLGGYGFDLSQGLLLEPRVAARYSKVQIDGFREKGSSAALEVGSQRYEVGELGAGVRLVSNLAVGQGSLEPQAKLMAYHDFIADQVSSTSAFVVGGTPFVTSGAKPARDSYEASLGVTYYLGAVSLGVSYDYLSKADYSADTVQARVRYDF